MQLQLRNPELADGDYPVYVNGSGMRNGSRGFGVIQLDKLGRVDLTFDEPEEFDRLIIAASAAKQMLINARTPHDFHPGDDGTARCLDCGVHKAHHLEPVITDDERDCDQANPETGHGCQRSGDHGVHRDAYGDEWRTDEPGNCATCSHPKGSHMSGSPRPCAMPGCDCGKFRPDNAPEPRCARPECGHHAAEHSNIENGECLVVLCPCARLELPEASL